MTSRSSNILLPVTELHENEQLKASSQHLRGSIAEGLSERITGAVPGDDPLLMKFHGIYQQDDRDLRAERRDRFLEPLYQFMVRLRIPGGRLSRKQWQDIDRLATKYAERGIRITTRQTIQLHGVRKHQLRDLMQGIRNTGLDTIAACGDDSRGVVCGADPQHSTIHQRVFELARLTSNCLIPKTKAYREIWYEESHPYSREEEPVYGDLYLPRKFKVGFAIPPINDIDVYAQDLGFIAVVENNKLEGFNVCVGGGMGKLDNREDSYPRLAEEIGFLPADEAMEFAEIVMGIQRDFGNRKDRHRARFKYTLDDLGIEWFLGELAERRGKSLAPLRHARFVRNSDKVGWIQSDNGNWQCTLYVESGRVDGSLRSQLEALFQLYGGGIRLTANQNLQLTDVGDYERNQLKVRLADLGLDWRVDENLQENNTLSCVALPTCGLAMAEAERYTTHFLAGFEELKTANGIADIPIALRITGCPNGCARPYLGEVALTGRAPGLYNLYLGGSERGDRLASLYGTNLDETGIFEALKPLLERFSRQRLSGESFGDFLMRRQILFGKDISITGGKDD